MSLLSKIFRRKRKGSRPGSLRQPSLESSKQDNQAYPSLSNYRVTSSSGQNKTQGKGQGKGGSKKTGRRSKMPAYPSYRKPKRTHWLERIITRSMLYGGLTVLAIIAWFSWGLPNIDELNKFTKMPSILVKSQDGEIIGSFGDIYGDYVPFQTLPKSLTDAVIATEDRNFYMHFGIDPFGLVRATFANVMARRVVQGGSTITQQVAKNVFLTPERSFSRKVREMILAIKLEQRFTKEEILGIYLNRVYLGAGSYGVDAASKRYFGKPASQMTLSESAIMAGLLKAPSRFSPTNSPTLARQRAEQVLINMQDAGYLNETQVAKAKEELTKTMNTRKKSSQSTLYFADWVMDQLPEYIGNVEQDIIVITTLRPDLQVIAEKAMSDIMDKEGDAVNAKQAAIVAMSPDGAIRVMIGGRSYAESQYNRATQALRQPGSAFKLFVYLAGLEAGLGPYSIINDQPLSIPVAGGRWQPHNYKNTYSGPITIREAVTESINTVAVQVSEMAGRGRVINVARRLGISSPLEPLPSIALGATEVSLLELTTAYTHMAANGAIVQPYGILEITDTAGHQVFRRTSDKQGVAIGSGIVAQMNGMLSNVISSGTGRAAQIGRPAAGKTGTTSDYKDAWFMGYTPDLAAGVWVGNDNNDPMKKVTGGQLPARIWHNFMIAALAKTPVRALPVSNGGGGGGNMQPAAEPLPWQSGGNAPAFPQDPAERRNNMGNAPRGKEHDLELPPTFWDKLFR